MQLLRGWYLDRYLERSVAQLRQRLEQWSHLLWDDFSFRTVSTDGNENKYLKKWLFDETGSNEIFILMITRLVPLFPYNLQNFAYGVTDIKFSTYSICSLIFMLPGTAMYTVGTAGLADKENRILYIGIALVLAVVVMGLGAFLKKHYVQEEKMKDNNTVEACTHCHVCQNQCEFLKSTE